MELSSFGGLKWNFLYCVGDWQCTVRAAGADVKTERDRRMAVVRSCSADLEGWSRSLGDHSPPWVGSSVHERHHYALWDCVSEACGLPDSRLVEELVCGAPAVGSCRDSGDFRADWQPAAANIDDLDHAAWHHEVERQLHNSGADPARLTEHEELWAATAQEVTKGFVFRIGTLADAIAHFGGTQCFREMVRFGVRQGCKLRPCDNARASLHNLCTELFERLTVESADFPARAAAYYAELLGEGASFAFFLGTEDISAAYRRFPCSEPWFSVFAQWDPTTSSVVYFRLEGFNFGLKSAVVAFNRLSFCLQQTTARLLGVSCSRYFDDFACAEAAFAKGGQQLLRDYAALLRLRFAGAYLGEPHSKSVGPAAVNTFLGVTHDFTRFPREQVSTACVDAARLLDLASDIQSILEAGSFAASAGPLKLAGRLQFTLSWGVGRFGRAALNPLHAAAAGGRSERISDALRAALEFIQALLVDPVTGVPRLQPRVFRHRRSRRPAVLVWSDARWEADDEKPAGLGFVVFFPKDKTEETKARASCAPPWLDGACTPAGSWRFAAYDPDRAEFAHWRDRKQYIGQLELLAAVSVYYSLAGELRGREVIHSIDNAGALACLIKDYSSDIDSARLVHTFWALSCALCIDVWFVFVYSDANIADWPSRGKVDFADDLGAVEVPVVIPPTDVWGDVPSAMAYAGMTQEPPRKKRRR